jgi:hypothetical protein
MVTKLLLVSTTQTGGHLVKECTSIHIERSDVDTSTAGVRLDFSIWAIGSSRIITKRLVRCKLALIKCADTLPF